MPKTNIKNCTLKNRVIAILTSILKTQVLSFFFFFPRTVVTSPSRAQHTMLPLNHLNRRN